MPKMKTHRGAAKRFRKTKRGEFKREKAFRNHLLTKKSGKRRRQLRMDENLTMVEKKRIQILLPYT